MLKNNLFACLLAGISLVYWGCGGTADNLREGNAAPDFTLQDSFGKTYSLSDFRDKSPVVIYFYPKANTPGCTKQACGVRDKSSRFEENKIKVIGISVDSKEMIKEFIDDHNLNFTLLSDENKKVSEAYGVLNNIGLASRITFVVDKYGIIRNILRDVDVSTHADEILNLAKALN